MTIPSISNPAPAHRETLYSYLSRLAATWQSETADLAYDMGAPFKRLLDQDPEALECLADWAGLKLGQLDELLSWTGVRAGNVRMEFRGELFVSRALRNPVMRGCPVCLREDAAEFDGPAIAAMVMRGDWQMREVTLCVRHHRPLISLWQSNVLKDRFNIGLRLQEIEDDIRSGALDPPKAPPSAYDLWLDRRLEDGRDDTWLKGHPVFAATTFCRLLGQALLREDCLKEEVARGAVHAAGFDVARSGQVAIRDAFDGIAARATGHLDEPNKAFGALFGKLNWDYLEEEGFGSFRKILRDCILDHWSIAPGELLLGEIVAERRQHSLRSAALETGVGSGVLKHFLIEAGAIPEQDDRPQSRQMFDAQTYSVLLAEIPTLVGRTAMREAMGATKRELMALEDEGVLIPRTRVAKVKNPWRISDGVALVAELLTGAIPVEENDTGWETLLMARRRAEGSLADLIGAIRAELLPVGQRKGVRGYHAIVIPKCEVDGLFGPVRKTGVAVEVKLPGVMSAAKFGRSVGLRGNGNFVDLIEAGHTPAQRILNPKTGRPQYQMNVLDITAFHQRFVTLTTLSTETGHHRNTLRGLLSAAPIAPFAPDEQDFGPLYLRSEVVAALGTRRK